MNTQQIMDRFFYRKNPFALKVKDGFIPIYRDVTRNDIMKHLLGEHIIGAYQSREDETCMWACIDFDDFKYESTAKDIFKDYEDEPLLKDCVFEKSYSKGFHIWFFFEMPMKTERAFDFLTSILKAYNLYPGRDSKIDIFPRSEHLSGKKVGWMVRLPRN